MKTFQCQACSQLVFFENTQCLRCERPLAWLPDLETMGALEDDGETWRLFEDDGGRRWKRCANQTQYNVCNWAIPADDPSSLCASCRFTRVIPDLTMPGNQAAWCKLETAKRRLLYSLRALDLPLQPMAAEGDGGLAFQFLADTAEGPAVLSGHANGLITINIAEADDAEREKRRTSLHEPYRTLLGHLRHEIGHYYWDRLIRDSELIDAFRELFGDERQDYSAALAAHYEQGPPADWQEHYVSAYASAHAWEDWAETWAHFLHIVDVLETAAVAGLALRPRDRDLPAVSLNPRTAARATFDDMIAAWFPVTYLINNLNRSLGQLDAYPFALSTSVVDKLRFLHETVSASRSGVATSPGPAASTASAVPIQTNVPHEASA